MSKREGENYNITERRNAEKAENIGREEDMISDERQKILAKNLVNYSCEVHPGENVLIEASGVPYQFVNALVKEVFAAGGYKEIRKDF